MNVAIRHKIMTIEDFLGWESRQDGKYEFDGFAPVAMTGGSVRHAAIQRNLAFSITSRLRGKRCSFFGNDLKIVTGSRVRYPDGQVLCGARDADATFSTAPTVVFEVVSPSTERIDRGAKVQEYAGIFSVQRYIVMEQDRASLVSMARVDDWAPRTFGPDDILAMPEIGIEIPVAELYEDVPSGTGQ